MDIHSSIKFPKNNNYSYKSKLFDTERRYETFGECSGGRTEFEKWREKTNIKRKISKKSTIKQTKTEKTINI